MNYVAQRIALVLSEAHMNVIRHYDPGKKPVARSIEKEQSVFNYFRYSLVLEPYHSYTSVEVFLDSPAPLDVQILFLQMCELAFESLEH